MKKTTDLAFPFKYSNRIALLRKFDGDCHTGRAAADYGSSPVLPFRDIDCHTIKIHVRYIFLNAGEMYRRFLDPSYTMSCTLFFVIADNRADSGHGIIIKEHFTRFHQSVFFEKLDHRGNRGVNRASLLTPWVFTVEAAVCLSDYM